MTTFTRNRMFDLAYAVLGFVTVATHLIKTAYVIFSHVLLLFTRHQVSVQETGNRTIVDESAVWSHCWSTVMSVGLPPCALHQLSGIRSVGRPSKKWTLGGIIRLCSVVLSLYSVHGKLRMVDVCVVLEPPATTLADLSNLQGNLAYCMRHRYCYKKVWVGTWRPLPENRTFDFRIHSKYGMYSRTSE